ncbi:bifunctional salicylyl-CoA 5-hydroxylase/oxidoreductase [Haloactinomyces albus]|uniref:Anthraniloyl-CoA monooxygenase n=1 Tax=Haloactinomyces albus TaxID=1352928 RepID=A0AAE4CRB9_9ACTN|nr:bifunctional salicylyl-CoA 5-hydroxylase/oxidoreductase [Haloactinomyces albus]MDR7303568.1 anthraniloyl-CoA monooxygenase [Haloactinomyces albus]
MRIAVVGGGPGGLYFSALVKQLDPRHEVTAWERNAAEDTFGFGVVFSDETLGGIEHADAEIHSRMQEIFAKWDDIDIHFRGATHTSGGQGFAAISRKKLLLILQERCRELDVRLQFGTEAPDVEELSAEYDLVLAADGANSGVRSRFTDVFGASLERRHSKYMWLGTDKVFEAFEFHIRETPYGVMQVHGYPYGDEGSTFLVEMHDDVWERAGFGELAPASLAPGQNDVRSVERIQELLGDVVGGHRIFVNNSKWANFITVRNETWRNGNIVLLGDAAHTAHFSIGSGTKLAMEDALALAACLHEHAEPETALEAYESERRPVVLSTQRAAQASLEWFENIAQYVHQEPAKFAFNILTRSRRITHDNLRLRDPEFVESLDARFAEQEARRGNASTGSATCPPMFQPYRIGQLHLKNRVVVPPMDMYSAVDGVPGDFHLVHLGSKALGGAGMVMTEMVCVSPEGRITPGCTGLYTPEQEESWKRVVDFVHARSTAKIGVQVGHSGRKGSTKLMWEGIDQPLEGDNWEVVAPSPIPYTADNQTPRELTETDLDAIVAQFVEAARAADRAGFDLFELHCAHGYLLSSFLSPLSNRRTDKYGGTPENRLRFPLRVFDAIREVWPPQRPLSIRISATDWAPGGNDLDDAVEISRAFAEHGVDVIHVSTGQVVKSEKPDFGRSYQTPFADRIRNEIGEKYGTTVIAVGAISSYDDVNSVLLAGRADLVALGRPHLYDPQWTLHAAAEQGYTGVEWPNQFAAGSRKPPTGRTDGPRPRLQLAREGEQGTRHRRWRP